MGVTHHGQLYSTGTIQGGGNVVATATGKTLKANALSVAATALFSGKVRVASAANAAAGLAAIIAANVGSTSVANTQVKASSRILLSPVAPTANYRGVRAWVSTIASGTSFKIKIGRTTTAGSNATASGRVGYMIINQ